MGISKGLFDQMLAEQHSDLYIGIDTGVHTGYAVWDGKHLEVETLMIHQAMSKVLELHKSGKKIAVYIEDPRQRKWFDDAYKSPEQRKLKLQGVGSVKRDAGIWDDFLKDHKITYFMIPPKRNTTKLSADQFKRLTGYSKRSSEHARDAAMLVFGK